jgi:hypothetical protein
VHTGSSWRPLAYIFVLVRNKWDHITQPTCDETSNASTLSLQTGMLVRRVFLLYHCQGRIRRVSASSTSTVHRGTVFEERSLKLLQDNFSMSLQRVGGREDGGIDLQGWWWLPLSSSILPADSAIVGNENGPIPRQRLRVVAQCKAEKKKTSPKYVRELEGVMLRFLASSSGTPHTSQASNLHCTADDVLQLSQFPLVGLLISESPFSKSTLLRVHSSPLPLFLLHLPQLESRCHASDFPRNDTDVASGSVENGTIKIGSAFWNPALAGPRGILKGEVEIRWERSLNNQGSQPGIWWRNQRLANWVPDNGISIDVITQPNGNEI